MELKSSITMFFLLFLVLARPILSQGRSDAVNLNKEIYEIDYRGPETHSYIPPPDRSGSNPFVHHESLTARHKLKGPRDGCVGDEGTTIHG